MSVFNRLTDIVNANLNAMLDQAEDPEKIVRLITQEMQDTLVEVRSTSARYLADRRQLEEQIRAVEAESTAWQDKAELAINKGRDDLAKSALREKSLLDDVGSRLQADLKNNDTAIEKLRGDTERLEQKLAQAKARQKALILRGQTAKTSIKVKRQLHDVSFDDALNRFDSYERRLDEMEGEVEAFDLGNMDLAAEIDSLENNHQLDAELASLKQRVAHESVHPRSEGS